MDWNRMNILLKNKIFIGAVVIAGGAIVVKTFYELFPLPNTKDLCATPPKGDSIVLSDGRRLGYSISGDLNGEYTLLLFHGIPGSRLFRNPNSKIAKILKIKIYTIERPGFGISSPLPNRTISDWSKDVKEFVEQMKIKKFAVLGYSFGGPYALACASSFPPSQLLGTAIVSGIAPYNGSSSGMHKMNQIVFWAAAHFHNLLYFALRGLTPSIRKPEKFVDMLIEVSNAKDKETLNKPEIRKIFERDLLEEFRQGPKAHVQDIKLCVRDWNLSLNTISSSNLIQFWHGTEDNWIPIEHSQRIANQIPHATLSKVDGEGHLLLFNYWGFILKQLFNIKEK